MSNTGSLRRIGIDCRLAGKKHAGIGRYIENLVSRLVTSPASTWVLFFHDTQQAKEVLGLPTLKAVPQNVELVFTPIRHYTLREQWSMPRLFLKENLDLLHIPHFNIPVFYPKKMVVTIHDLLWHEQRGAAVTTLPFHQYWLKYLAYKFTAKQAVKKAEGIFVPTKTVARTLAEYYPESITKTRVTYEGVSEMYQQSFKKSIKNRKKELLYIGSLYPHKNLKLILQALSFLPKYRLTLIGSRNIFQKQVKKNVRQLGLSKRVTFAGYLDDKQVKKKFNTSFALVFPSLSEGFGLPGVEAMSAGLPVLASDIPVFREVYEKGAIYFDPYSVESFVNALKTLESQYRKQQEIGKQVAQKYNWDDMVKQTEATYEEILS